MRRPRLPQRLQNDEIVGEERIRPAQGAHRDVVRGPCADARKCRQRREGRVRRRSRVPAGSRRTRPPRRAATSVRARACVTPSLASRPAGTPRCAPPRETARVSASPSSVAHRLAERPRDAAEQRARGAHRDLLADHGANGKLEAVERAGNAQAGTRRRRAGPAPRRRRAGSQARSNACFTRDSTAGTARASDGDTETRSADLRGERRTSIRPDVQRAPMRDRDRPRVGVARHRFDARRWRDARETPASTPSRTAAGTQSSNASAAGSASALRASRSRPGGIR